MSTYCKIYDKLHFDSTCETELTTSSSTLKTQLDSLNQSAVNLQPELNKAYVERVEIDNDDIDITNLFDSSLSQSHTHEPFQFNDVSPSEGSDLDELREYVSEPTEISDTIIKGNGWKLELNADWRLEKNENNYTLKKK